jgi:hypothetical protein
VRLTDNPFPDMITPADLVGTWRFYRPDEGVAFLHFSYTRAFDFICDGEVRQPLKLWYELEDTGRIRFRTRQGDVGWTCGIEFQGNSLVITGELNRTVCVRALPSEIPVWFQEGLANLS